MALQTTLVVPNFSVIDMVSQLYGGLDYITEFLLSNPSIGAVGVDADLRLFTGQSVLYDPAVTNPIPAPLSFPPPPSQTTVATVFAQPTMSVWDICLQAYGSLDLVGKFMNDNDIPGIDTLPAGNYTYNTLLATDQQMNQYNAFNGILYATLWVLTTQAPPAALLLMEIAPNQGGPYVLLEDSADILLENQNS